MIDRQEEQKPFSTVSRAARLFVMEKRYIPFVLVLMIGLITFGHVTWLQKDNRYQPFVDAYPESTLEITDHLTGQGLRGLPQLLEESRVGPRFPLYQFGMALFVLLFGRTVDVMLGFNLVMNVVLIVAAFFAGRLVKNRSVGLLAALFVATFPPLVDLTRVARAHAALPAVVMVWLLVLLQMEQRRSVASVWQVSLLLGLALLLHPNSFYLLVAPTLVLTLYTLFGPARGQSWAEIFPGLKPAPLKATAVWLWSKLRRPLFWKGMLPGFALAFLFAAAWYFFVREDALRVVQNSAANWSNVRYGFSNIPANFWWYLWTFPGAITNFFTAVFLAGLLINLFTGRRYPFLLSVIFLLMYLGIGLREGTLAWMNFAAVLPVVGLVTAVFLDDLLDLARRESPPWFTRQRLPQAGPLLAIFLVFAAVFLSLFNFYYVSDRVPETATQFAQTLGAPLEDACGWRMTVVYCPNPPNSQDWQENEILQTILAAQGCQDDPCSVAVVTESAEIFSFASLSYFLLQDFPHAALDIAPIRSEVLRSVDWLTMDFIVYIPQLQNNEYANSVVTFLEDPPADFAEVYQAVGQVSLPRGWHAVVLKRERRLSEQEVYHFVDALTLPAAEKMALDIHFTLRGIND